MKISSHKLSVITLIVALSLSAQAESSAQIETPTDRLVAESPFAESSILESPILESPVAENPVAESPAVLEALAQEPETTNVDPWQGFNRTVFSFNLKADRYFLKPLAKAYVRLTPSFFRQGVTNVFSNVLEVPSALNGVLQGKLATAAHSSGRLLVNTTLGVVGLFDVAQHMGLQGGGGEDFGQTLATWGVGQGPYLMLPFLGPSTLRDTLALPVDWVTDPKAYIDHVPTSNTVRGTSLVNTRAGFLQLEKSITGDKYVFIRDVYLQRRTYLINDGVVEDSFGADEGSEDY